MPTTKHIGIARGTELRAKPTVASSTTSLAIEAVLVLDDGAGSVLSRAEALAGLEAIKGALSVGPWPPS